MDKQVLRDVLSEIDDVRERIEDMDVVEFEESLKELYEELKEESFRIWGVIEEIKGTEDEKFREGLFSIYHAFLITATVLDMPYLAGGSEREQKERIEEALERGIEFTEQVVEEEKVFTREEAEIDFLQKEVRFPLQLKADEGYN